MYGFLCEKVKRSDETSLCDYLHAIFPGHEIICDDVVPTDVLKSRGCTVSRRYRPDARIEDLNLIVEFDGIHHYRDANVIFKSVERDVFFETLGYKVVRIPFYIQLCPETIKYYFGIDSEIQCKYTSGFHSRTSDEFALNPCCPANFCSLGWNGFNNEYIKLPEKIQKEILSTILIYCRLYPEFLVIPWTVVETKFLADLTHYDEFYGDLCGFGYERIQESSYCKRSSIRE